MNNDLKTMPNSSMLALPVPNEIFPPDSFYPVPFMPRVAVVSDRTMLPVPGPVDMPKGLAPGM